MKYELVAAAGVVIIRPYEEVIGTSAEAEKRRAGSPCRASQDVYWEHRKVRTKRQPVEYSENCQGTWCRCQGFGVSVVAEKKTLAKPFLKWAGGKGQLLAEIERRLPAALKAGRIDTYVEPFVGRGAVFFRIAQTYPAIKHFYLFDINDDLVNCYNAIKGNVDLIIAELKILNQAFLRKRTRESKKQLFLSIREEFNQEKLSNFAFATAAKLIFLNKTCYNGLYRVNRKGQFNVPFGDYKKPTICDEENLMSASEILQNAEILCGDFEISQKYINRKTLVYFDPPYRPLSQTASFTSYSKQDFGEREQMRLVVCQDC